MSAIMRVAEALISAQSGALGLGASRMPQLLQKFASAGDSAPHAGQVTSVGSETTQLS